jgi:hypothetical protein
MARRQGTPLRSKRGAMSERTEKTQGPQSTADEGSSRREQRLRERALDKTVEDSFPSSDPPSSIPNPGEEDPQAA